MGEVDRVIRRARFELMLSRHLQSVAVALLLLCAFFGVLAILNEL